MSIEGLLENSFQLKLKCKEESVKVDKGRVSEVGGKVDRRSTSDYGTLYEKPSCLEE